MPAHERDSTPAHTASPTRPRPSLSPPSLSKTAFPEPLGRVIKMNAHVGRLNRTFNSAEWTGAIPTVEILTYHMDA